MADASTGDGSRPMLPRRELTTPRSAAIAGILFAVLLGTSLVLLRVSLPSRQEDAGRLLSDPDRRRIVRWALNLVPFAGIAFLWFIGVVRDRIGAFEDRFFSTTRQWRSSRPDRQAEPARPSRCPLLTTDGG